MYNVNTVKPNWIGPNATTRTHSTTKRLLLPAEPWTKGVLTFLASSWYSANGIASALIKVLRLLVPIPKLSLINTNLIPKKKMWEIVRN